MLVKIKPRYEGVIRALIGGMEIPEVARECHISGHAIELYMTMIEMPERPRRKKAQSKLGKLIYAHGKTQKEVAIDLHIQEADLSRIALGNKNPSPHMICAIADAIGCDASEVLEALTNTGVK